MDLYNELQKAAHQNPTLRSAVLPLLRQAAGAEILWEDILRVSKELEKIVQKYVGLQRSTTHSQYSGHTSSGFIRVAKYGDPSHFLIGISYGSRFGIPEREDPYESTDMMLQNMRHREALINKIKAEVDSVLLPFLKEQPRLSRVMSSLTEQDGSNYGTYGIKYYPWMNVT